MREISSNGDRGKDFERELKESIENAGVLVHRIRDSATFYKGRKIGQKNPCDFYAWSVNEGRVKALAIEAKATLRGSIPLENLKPHQLESLLEFDCLADDMLAYVAVNFYGANLRTLNRCFMVPVSRWSRSVVAAQDGGPKSISMQALGADPLVCECAREKGSVWDMRGWVSSLWGR